MTVGQTKSQNLSNLTMIITGANTGLGLEAAKQLVSLDCVSRLILACRSLEKGAKAKEILTGIYEDSGRGKLAPSVEVWQLDMANLKSIRAFADRCEKDLERIDCVILNAGVDMAKYERAGIEDGGYEMTIMVNVIGTFVLAILMVEVLRRKMGNTSENGGQTNPPRITIVGSAVQFFAKYQPLLDGAQSQEGVLKSLNSEKGWDGQDRYYLSKGIVQMLVRQLARRISEGDKSGKSMVILNCVAPGYCRTELFREAETFASRLALKLIGRDADVGARALVVGAVGKQGGIGSHGEYMTEGVVKDSCSWYATEQGERIGKMMWEEVLEVVESVKQEAVSVL